MGIILMMFKIIAIIITSFLWLVLILLLLIIFLLLIPIKYNAVISKNPDITGEIKAYWLFNAISFTYIINRDGKSFINLKLFWKTISGRKKTTVKNKLDSVKITDDKIIQSDKKNKKKNVKSRKKKDKRKKNNDKFSFMSIITHPDRNVIIAETINTIKKLLGALSPKVFSLKAEIGADDPSLTGLIIGIFYIIKGICKLNMDIIGDFTKKKLVFDLNIKGDLNLLSLLWEIILYVLKRPIWNLIKNNIL